MKIVNVNGREMACYQEADMEDVWRYAGYAADLWRDECWKTFERMGDWGSSVLGAGIEIPFMKPRAKYPTYKMIISASYISPAQGSCVWEESVQMVLDKLATMGVVGARYNCGRMD